ncbi:hypothetical protein [Micromonospora sp. NPDC049107]|uniref:hypothetical protein n=1 Tax=unclassified Micromonospora TaxID=2617518 RepID=UPI0033FDB0B0
MPAPSRRPERPLRLAEFDRFFTTEVRGVDRLSARHLRLRLDGAARVEELARDLAARESSCCAFFTFGFSRPDPDLLDAGRHQHRGRSDTGLQVRAREKLVEIEQKLADLTVIRDTLRDAISAGCDDLVTCAASTCCPLPFAELAEQRQEGSRAR